MSRITPVQKELLKFTASDMEASDEFGGAVCISGKYAIVGSKLEDTGASNAGAAYIFVQNDDLTWQQVAKLQADNLTASSNFGCSVAINEKFALVGALNEDTGGSNAGSVYVFEQQSDGTWKQEQKLQASDKEANDYFGTSVALSDGYAVVGATGEDTNGSASGAAYVFEVNDAGTWREVKKLKGSNIKANDNFGNAVAINGDRLIVAAYLLDTDGVSGSGACYIYERNSVGNWQEIQRIFAQDKEANDNFGISVGLDGDYAIIGSNQEDNGFSGAGAAYVFQRAQDGVWDQQAKLQASDMHASAYFGTSVDISGNTAIIGATGKDDTNRDTGGAYLFQNNDGIWTEHKRLQVSDRQIDDQLGNAVSISGPLAVIGSSLSDTTGSNSGAAYLFETDGNGSTGGGNGNPDLGGSLTEGLLLGISGGQGARGHSGDDVGSFVCDGEQQTCFKLPGLKDVKSVALWVKITEDRDGERYLLDARDTRADLGLDNGFIHTRNFGNGWNKLWVDGVEQAVNAGSYDSIPKNQWTHVYVEAVAPFNDNINIMSNYLEGENMKGSVDEIRLYNRVLTEEEIVELANS